MHRPILIWCKKNPRKSKITIIIIFFYYNKNMQKKKKIPHQAINTWNDWGKKVVSRENKHKKITFVPTNHQIRE